MNESDLEASTPVDPDEADALVPGHIHTRDELNSWEQANILAAAEWVRRTRKPALDEQTIRELHRRMFDKTWTWAGTYRTSDKNIGVPRAEIPVRMRNMIDDGRFWLLEDTFPAAEAVLRLHHRLVWIHPFPNGNGRHARLWCDLLMRELDLPLIEWKSDQLNQDGDARRRYLQALRKADSGDFDDLLEQFLPGLSHE